MVINDTFFWRSLQDRVLYMHITFDCSFINCLFVSDDFCDIFSVPEKRTTILSYINFISLFVMISTYICKCTNFREIYFLVLWKQSPKDSLQKSYPVNLRKFTGEHPWRTVISMKFLCNLMQSTFLKNPNEGCWYFLTV